MPEQAAAENSSDFSGKLNCTALCSIILEIKLLIIGLSEEQSPKHGS